MKAKLFLFYLVILFLLMTAAQSPAGTTRILVVHSYHETQKGHVVEMTEGLNDSLSSENTFVRYFHMDTKRNTSEEWKYDAGVRAKNIVASFQPDIIITFDDNAQQYFAKDYAGDPQAPIFVFSGVNKDPAIYGFPANNVTGILERPNISESIGYLQKILPQTQNLLLLSDHSPTSDAFMAYAKSLDLPIGITAYKQPKTFDEFKQILEEYSDKVDAVGVYLLRTIERGMQDTTKIPETELIAYLNDIIQMPTVGFADNSADMGVLCGISVSMKEQGFAAGELVKKIISGIPPTKLPILPTKKGRIQLNLQTAEKLGIPIKYSLIKRADVLVR